MSGVLGADPATDAGALSLAGDARDPTAASDIHEAGNRFEEIEDRSWDLTVAIGASP